MRHDVADKRVFRAEILERVLCTQRSDDGHDESLVAFFDGGPHAHAPLLAACSKKRESEDS